MEKCCENIQLNKMHLEGLRNSFLLPILSGLSEYLDSKDLLKLIEKLETLPGQEILDILGLDDNRYRTILEQALLISISQGVSEIGILSLNPFLAKNVFDTLGLSGIIYVRASDLDDFRDMLNSNGEKIKFGVFVDPYVDGDELTNEVSDFCAKHKVSVMINLYDELEKTGELNSTYNLTPIEYVESIGLLDRDFKILGGVYADKDDFNLISGYGGKIVVCPYESLNFGRGSPNVYAMQNSGVEVELSSPIINDIEREVEITSVVSRGLLNDPNILEVSEVFEMAKIDKPRIELSEEVYKNTNQNYKQIIKGVLEKICR